MGTVGLRCRYPVILSPPGDAPCRGIPPRHSHLWPLFQWEVRDLLVLVSLDVFGVLQVCDIGSFSSPSFCVDVLVVVVRDGGVVVVRPVF